MASRTFHPIQAINREVKIIAGSFAPDGSGEITDIKGRGFTVARTGTGEFTLTLEDKYVEMLSANAQLQLATPNDQNIVVGASDVSDAKTIVLTNMDTGSNSPQDITADANNRVNFVLNLRNSSVK